MFAMCEQEGMANPSVTPIAMLRKALGLTLEDFGDRIGLKSKGQVSEIEKTGRCSPEVALQIEALSNFEIDAGSLNAVVASARRQVAA